MIYTSRPKPSHKMARMAWDFFSLNHQMEPIEMWLGFLDYYCWICKWSDGDSDDIGRHEFWEKGSTERNRSYGKKNYLNRMS